MDGLRLSNDGKVLEWAREGIDHFEIPNGITTIGELVFHGNTSLKSIIIPNSVTSIGKGAFSGCTSLKSIDIPNSVKEIGDWAFQDCTSLENIFIPLKSATIFTESVFSCFPPCFALQGAFLVLCGHVERHHPLTP